MNKVCLIANERFEPGLIAFLNSYKLSGNTTPIAIIDTGLKGTYPYETVQVDTKKFSKYKKASWMKDASAYLQCEITKHVEHASKYLYLEVDMLVLGGIDNLFDKIDPNIISTMDDAAFATLQGDNYIDNCGRYFVKDSALYKKYARCKGYNCGLVGADHWYYSRLAEAYKEGLEKYENQYRLLAQSLLNQSFVTGSANVFDIGIEYNFSGINEYYDKPELYEVIKTFTGYQIRFNGKNVIVPHFTGPRKPWLVKEVTPISHVWDFYYNNGELF